MAHTVADFWQMVWEQGSVVLVMLSKLSENGHQLAHRYWPEVGSEQYHIFEVHLVSEHVWCNDYLQRWKNVQILQIYLCYFFSGCANILAVCAKDIVPLPLCEKQYAKITVPLSLC